MEKENIGFDKNLEDNYIFNINLNKDCGGAFGKVYFATMTRKNSSKEIPIVLKTFKTRFDIDIDMFNNEKEIFEVLSQNPQEDIVKCYGIVNINNTKYIVMEDLTKQNFTTLGNVFDKLDELQKDNNQGKYQ